MTVAVPRLRHFIGGTWTESRGDRWIHDVNPSDSTDVIAHVPEGVADDVASAVNAASPALDGARPDRLQAPALAVLVGVHARATRIGGAGGRDRQRRGEDEPRPPHR